MSSFPNGGVALPLDRYTGHAKPVRYWCLTSLKNLSPCVYVTSRMVIFSQEVPGADRQRNRRVRLPPERIKEAVWRRQETGMESSWRPALPSVGFSSLMSSPPNDLHAITSFSKSQCRWAIVHFRRLCSLTVEGFWRNHWFVKNCRRAWTLFDPNCRFVWFLCRHFCLS